MCLLLPMKLKPITEYMKKLLPPFPFLVLLSIIAGPSTSSTFFQTRPHFSHNLTKKCSYHNQTTPLIPPYTPKLLKWQRNQGTKGISWRNSRRRTSISLWMSSIRYQNCFRG